MTSGFLTFAGGGSGATALAPVEGEHSLNKNEVFSLHDGAITPNNVPGEIWKPTLGAPVHNKSKAFDEQEAGVAEVVAEKRERQAKATKRVDRAHAKIRKADSSIHQSNHNMFRRENRFSLRVSQINGETHKQLQNSRPEYARLGLNADQDEQVNTNIIGQMRSLLFSK